MSSPSPPTLESALSQIPSVFRTRILKHFVDLKRAFIRGEFDSCGSRSGKFCETLIRYLQNELEGTYSRFGQQINLYDESRRLERLPSASGPEALRIFIPRALCFLYTLRNKRGFAHVGGDIDSDPIDAATCVRVADWCLCEIIRVVHNLSMEEAQALINAVATRELPDIWSVFGKKRVLRQGLDYKSQTLLLLYSQSDEATLVEDLFAWTEYSRIDNYKSRVLKPMHDQRLIEWDRATETVILSPTGAAKVEDELLIESPAQRT